MARLNLLDRRSLLAAALAIGVTGLLVWLSLTWRVDAVRQLQSRIEIAGSQHDLSRVLVNNERISSTDLLFRVRVFVSVLFGGSILGVILINGLWRAKHVATQRELRQKVDEQTAELNEMVSRLEKSNTEQAIQARDRAEVAIELQRALDDAELQMALVSHASKRFESLFNGLPVGCATFNLQTEIMEWNATMSDVAHCQAYEAMLRPLNQVFSGLGGGQLERAAESALCSGEVTSFEAELAVTNSPPFVLHVSVFPMRQKSGEIVGGIMCAFDVTSAAQAARAIALSEAKLRAFIDHAPAAVAIFDKDLRYLAASRRWYSDYGIEQQSIIGMSHYEVFPEVPDDWKAVHQRALGGETVTCDEDRFERGGGAVQWLKWEVRPWFDVDGEIGGIAMITEDVSERKQVMEELFEAHQKTNAANKALEAKQRELKDANAHLKALATTDGLTGIHNHRHFQDYISARFDEARRDGTGLAVLLMDVDKFKSFNDEFGHQAGDKVLKAVATCLKGRVPEPHLVARYGGEEFVVVAVGVTEAEALTMAEDLRSAIAATKWPHRKVTASFGVAMLDGSVEKTRDLIERADQALYQAKETGRDRTCLYRSDEVNGRARVKRPA